MAAPLTPTGGSVSISLCTIIVLLFSPVIASAPPQQSANGNLQKPALVDPCANAATDAEKKACWKELARRADFILNPDPCEDESHRSDEDRDNCKIDRAKQASARVDAYYQSIRKSLRADLSKGKAAKWDDPTLLAQLRDTQSAWTRYRDLQCEAETAPYDGGTITFSIKAGCEREKAEVRLKELQLIYARYLKSD